MTLTRHASCRWFRRPAMCGSRRCPSGVPPLSPELRRTPLRPILRPGFLAPQCLESAPRPADKCGHICDIVSQVTLSEPRTNSGLTVDGLYGPESHPLEPDRIGRPG